MKAFTSLIVASLLAISAGGCYRNHCRDCDHHHHDDAVIIKAR